MPDDTRPIKYLTYIMYVCCPRESFPPPPPLLAKELGYDNFAVNIKSDYPRPNRFSLNNADFNYNQRLGTPVADTCSYAVDRCISP